LKEDMSYHITVRGTFVCDQLDNVATSLNYIEYSSFNPIKVNIDETVSGEQYFELSYDIFRLPNDMDYQVGFDASNGHISSLTVEVHSLSNLNTTLTGGQMFDQGWGILIEDNVISVDPTIFNDYVTFNDLTQAVTGLHEEITVETTELVCSVSSVLQAEIDNIQQSVQSDWNQTDNTQPDYIKNKPDLTEFATHDEVIDVVTAVSTVLQNEIDQIPPQVQADWGESDVDSVRYIRNKPDLDIYATNDMVTSVSSTLQNEIDNIPEQVQSDWEEDDDTEPSYIQNKPVPKTLVAGPGIEITDTVTGVEITAAVTAIEGYVTEQEFIEVVSAVTGTGDYGQFYCNTASGACVMGKIKGTIDVTNDGKIKLEKGKSYHISVRGCYKQSSASNVEDTIGFVEYVTNNAIQINVDRTITSAQYFDLGFDVYNLVNDVDYYVFFNGVNNAGIVQDVFVDVHTILGGGGGNGGEGGGAEYNQGWGIVITNNTISVNPNIIPDISNLATKDEVSIAIATATGAQINPDWNNDNPLSKAYIQNKPEELTLVGGNNVEIDIVGASAIINVTGGGGTQVQSDWTEYNPNNPAYIKNKPTIPEDKVYIFWDFEFNRTAIRAAIDAHKVIMDWDRTSNEHRFFTKYEEVTIEGNLCEVYHFAHVETDYTTPYATTWRLGDMAYIYDTVRQVQWSEHDVKMFDHEVPSPTSSDAGKVLTASWDSEQASGSWSWQAAGGGGGGTQVQSNWTETNTSDPSYIQNKPDLSDYATVASVTAVADSIPEIELNSYSQVTAIDGHELAGGGGTQVQSDWTEDNTSDPSYIKNKPEEQMLVAGNNVEITVDGASAIISAQGGGTTYSAGDGIEINGTEISANISAGSGISIDNNDGELVINTTEMVSGLQLVAGPGIVFTVSGSNLVAKADETVLWSNPGPQTNTKDITWSSQSLSESIANFERVKFIYSTDQSGYAPHEITFLVRSTEDSYVLQDTYASASMWLVRIAIFNLNGTSITNTSNVTRNMSIPTNGGTISCSGDGAGYNILYKVVGINRISS
ncbi:MAG: hypothetical protein IIZ78_04885, partial [Clostridiales bacterium]|nr:hypothetical protein [Clostridiales bacterium]